MRKEKEGWKTKSNETWKHDRRVEIFQVFATDRRQEFLKNRLFDNSRKKNLFLFYTLVKTLNERL